MATTDLLTLREEIDELDEKIIQTLGQRFRVTDKVGKLKATTGLNPVDPEREARQLERFAQLASQHFVNAALVEQIFRAVIDEVVANHQFLAVSSDRLQF